MRIFCVSPDGISIQISELFYVGENIILIGNTTTTTTTKSR